MKCGSGQHKLKVCATKERYIIRNGIRFMWRCSESQLKSRKNIKPIRRFMSRVVLVYTQSLHQIAQGATRAMAHPHQSGHNVHCFSRRHRVIVCVLDRSDHIGVQPSSNSSAWKPRFSRRGGNAVFSFFS